MEVANLSVILKIRRNINIHEKVSLISYPSFLMQIERVLRVQVAFPESLI
jgi:hypothetical protein